MSACDPETCCARDRSDGFRRPRHLGNFVGEAILFSGAVERERYPQTLGDVVTVNFQVGFSRNVLVDGLPAEQAPRLTSGGIVPSRSPVALVLAAKVWDAARRASRFLVTQDLDFSDVRAFKPSTHAGILLLRLPALSRRLLEQYVEQLFRTEDVESWARCFVIATPSKVRVRRPDAP